MTTPRRPSKLGPFNLGVNNRAADTDLDSRAGSFLRAGANIDLTTEGRIRRREGYSSVMAGSNMHSLFTTDKRMFVVDGVGLYEVTETSTGLAKTLIHGGIHPQARLSFCESGDDVFYTTGTENRVITPSGERAMTVPTPNPSITLTTIVGSLDPGLYQVCAAFMAEDGRFSGATEPVQIAVAEGQGFSVLGLPTDFPPGVVALQLFATPCDDSSFMHLGILTAPAAPGATFDVPAGPDLTYLCPTMHREPLPAGHIIRRTFGGARTLVASGDTLYYTEPFLHGLYDPLAGYIRFEDEIAVVECARGGVYVATKTKTYRLPTDLASSELELILPYGGVRGASGVSSDQITAWWMSARGLVRVGEADDRNADNLAPGGESVVNMQEEALAMHRYASGAALYRESNGVKQIISSLFNAETVGAAAYSYFDAEIIRKGTKP